MPKVLDLFAGVGGMAEGFLQAGFSIPYASDISEQAALNYKNRHNQLGFNVSFYCGDIGTLANEAELSKFLGDDLNKIDVICGGPPCQGFSIAGRRSPTDKRNLLVKNYIKILKLVQPKYFVMENVQGILSSKFLEYKGLARTYRNEKVTDVLIEEFAYVGYSVEFKILDASDYGVPQQRMRVIFLGTHMRCKNKLLHPEPLRVDKVTAKEAIDDLKKIKNGSKEIKYTQNGRLSIFQQQSRDGRTPISLGLSIKASEIHNHETSNHSEHVIERFSLLKQGESLKNLFDRLPSDVKDRLATKKHTCRKMIAEKPSYTVLTLPDDLVHYDQNRILTVREMARLQSFDDSFEFLGKRTTGGDRRTSETPQYTLVGNAVPPLLAKAIAMQIMSLLKKE